VSNTTNNLLILGAGQYSFVIEDIAHLGGNFSQIHCLDDKVTRSQRVVGCFNELAKFREEHLFAIVAIGNPNVRRELTASLLRLGYKLPILVHPRAWISPTASVADGCILEANAIVNANAVVGLCSFICAGAVINHNACVGDFCQIDCNATVPARAVVPQETKVNCGEIYAIKQREDR